jgi:holo-[acyl-carrier protein] synthase
VNVAATEGAQGVGDDVLGIGTDLVEVDRLRQALERTPSLRARLFTDDEWAYSCRHRDPIPHLAARFAAKEAAMKALGAGMSRMPFGQVEVVRDAEGVPSLRLHGAAAELARSAGVRRWHLSLTHTGALAQAFAVAIGTPQGPAGPGAP